MTDPKDVTFELNVFGEEPRCHLKLTGPGTPSLEFVVSAFERLQHAQEMWAHTERAPAEVQEYDEPPYDEPDTAPTEPPRESVGQANRPLGGATEAQCKKVLAVCHRLSEGVVTKAIEGYPGAEYRLDKDGHCLPDWGFLQSLTKHQASNVIERLERAEA